MVRVVICVSGLMSTPGAARGQDPSYPKTTYVYKSVGETRIEVDVFRPADDKVRPVVVWIHGGGLINGNRAMIPAHVRDVCRSEGFALASFDYRLAPEVRLPEIAKDVDDAFIWLQEQGKPKLKIDPNRCMVAGESAGGYLALLVGTRLKRPPLGLIAYYPFTDIRDVDTPAYIDEQRKKFPPARKEDAYRSVGGKVLTGTSGEQARSRDPFFTYVLQNGLWCAEVAGFPPTDRKQRELFSPVVSAKRNFPPTLLIHGTADKIVPHKESAAMAQHLAGLGVPHELISVPQGGHGLGGADQREIDAAYARAGAFLRQRLSPR